MGSRVCAGQQLAWLEMKLVITKLLLKFEILPEPDKPIPDGERKHSCIHVLHSELFVSDDTHTLSCSLSCNTKEEKLNMLHTHKWLIKWRGQHIRVELIGHFVLLLVVGVP
jgi:hypothetical protein